MDLEVLSLRWLSASRRDNPAAVDEVEDASTGPRQPSRPFPLSPTVVVSPVTRHRCRGERAGPTARPSSEAGDRASPQLNNSWRMGTPQTDHDARDKGARHQTGRFRIARSNPRRAQVTNKVARTRVGGPTRRRSGARQVGAAAAGLVNGLSAPPLALNSTTSITPTSAPRAAVLVLVPVPARPPRRHLSSALIDHERGRRVDASLGAGGALRTCHHRHATVTITAPTSEPTKPLARSSSPSPAMKLARSPPTNEPTSPATSARPQLTRALEPPSSHCAAAPTTMPNRMIPRINTIAPYPRPCRLPSPVKGDDARTHPADPMISDTGPSPFERGVAHHDKAVQHRQSPPPSPGRSSRTGCPLRPSPAPPRSLP